MENLSVAAFLPDVALPSVPEATPVKLRESGGRTTVLLTVHDSRCSGCRDYIDAIAGAAGEFAVWDARLLVLVPGSPDDAAHLQTFGTMLADEQNRLAQPASASLVVADRYGQIFFAARSGSSHALPSVRELEEWLKFLGTLCPE
jgi:hypothetical protein